MATQTTKSNAQQNQPPQPGLRAKTRSRGTLKQSGGSEKSCVAD